MSLKYLILIMFVIAFCSRSSAQRCSRSYVDGKWILAGDCGGADMMSDIMGDLKRRSEEEKKKWTVFQRRKYGNVDFYRGWDDYKNGFGNRGGDFWLGLAPLHQITKGGNMEMKIKMITRDGIYWVAKYSSFHIGPGSDNYRLHVSGYSGNATVGDRLAYHNNQQFSTNDADHDAVSRNCASLAEGGWWYRECYQSNLNGNFHKTGDAGVALYAGSSFINLRFTEMKFRKRPGN